MATTRPRDHLGLLVLLIACLAGQGRTGIPFSDPFRSGCGPPTSIPPYSRWLEGATTIGSLGVFVCNKGYVPWGKTTIQCLANREWDIPKFVCKDCGTPPVIVDAYSGIGPSIIGSVRRYQCNQGYDMVGQSAVECLANGVWSTPSFKCAVSIPVPTKIPAPVRSNPSVCDNCRMRNSVGYNPHPFDCTRYVQCFYGPTGGIEAVYMSCPFGQYWDHVVLTCRPSEQVDCPTEKCLDPYLIHYKHTDYSKCSAYWRCDNGKSVAMCCEAGYRYVYRKGCVPDLHCTALCPYEEMFPGCDKRPLLDMTRFEQHIGNGYWVRMSCAPGTAFNIIDCECSLHTGLVPGYVCRPELYMDFEDGQIGDISGNHLYIINEGVAPFDKAAYFNGSSRLIINRFSNTAFHGNLVIKLRYNEHLKGPTADQLQALITNGDCGDDPSVIVAKMPGYVLLGAKTTDSKSFALPVVDKEWKEVIYIHDEKKLEGKVCGAAYNKWSWGPIQGTHCGVQIGHGTKLQGFTGLMDDIAIYQCLPSDEVLSVYGGRRFVPQPPLSANIH